MCQAAASAIANPENTYLTLAKIVITEIKQAQELVSQSKEAEIAISQQLEALLSFPEIELLEITPADLVEEKPATVTELLINTLEHQRLSEQLLPPQTANLPVQDSITSLSELTEQFNFDEDTGDRDTECLEEHPSVELK